MVNKKITHKQILFLATTVLLITTKCYADNNIGSSDFNPHSYSMGRDVLKNARKGAELAYSDEDINKLVENAKQLIEGHSLAYKNLGNLQLSDVDRVKQARKLIYSKGHLSQLIQEAELVQNSLIKLQGHKNRNSNHNSLQDLDNLEKLISELNNIVEELENAVKTAINLTLPYAP